MDQLDSDPGVPNAFRALCEEVALNEARELAACPDCEVKDSLVNLALEGALVLERRGDISPEARLRVFQVLLGLTND